MSTKKSGAVTIRRVTQKDVDAVLALAGSLITRVDLMALNLGGPLDLSFASEHGGRIIGFIIAQMEYLGIPLTPVCLIRGLVVEDEYQQQGIGNSLVNELVNHCRAKKIKTMRALIDESDTNLRRFVDRLGFRPASLVVYDMTLPS